MALHRLPIAIIKPDAGVSLDQISNQIAAAAAPSVGQLLCYILADGGSDEGIYAKFSVPKNFVSAPKLVFRGILDGAPGASDVLGLGVRKRAVANNETADGAFDAEEVSGGNPTIGSGGSGHADEDVIEVSVTLTAEDYSVDDDVFVYAFLDSSVNTYAGNFLLFADDGLFFEYSDA